jgi:indole-3-glycerol phosphate synthase
LLETIVAATRRIVEVRSDREPMASLARRAECRRPERGRFRAAIGDPGRLNVIAECKRRSPSRGVLRTEYDPAALALAYAHGGAAAISVLTEPTFFDGALAHLQAVRGAVDLPLLRKDFIVSEYQLYEARACGADAVLLIAAALRAAALGHLIGRATALELDVLVEVHDAAELDLALEAGAGIVGVNNRNLRTLEVDTRVSETLVGMLPGDVIAVSESGLTTGEALATLRTLGYRAFLIGERLMREADPGAALSRLISSARAHEAEGPPAAEAGRPLDDGSGAGTNDAGPTSAAGSGRPRRHE